MKKEKVYVVPEAHMKVFVAAARQCLEDTLAEDPRMPEGWHTWSNKAGADAKIEDFAKILEEYEGNLTAADLLSADKNSE